jgi:hypothetical protein
LIFNELKKIRQIKHPAFVKPGATEDILTVTMLLCQIDNVSAVVYGAIIVREQHAVI